MADAASAMGLGDDQELKRQLTAGEENAEEAGDAATRAGTSSLRITSGDSLWTLQRCLQIVVRYYLSRLKAN